MTWYVGGYFMRCLLKGVMDTISATSPLTVMLVSTRNSTVDKLLTTLRGVLSELEVMGVVNQTTDNDIILTRGRCGVSAMHAITSFKATIYIASGGMFSIPVELKAYQNMYDISNDKSMVLTSDPIVLGEDGIKLLASNAAFDRHNMVLGFGLGLLERMIDMKDNVIMKHSKYSNEILDDWVKRAKDVESMLREHEVISEGFKVEGDTLKVCDNTTDICAICLEGGKTFVELRCSHRYCLSCLGNHMIESVSGNNCPLCRGPTILAHGESM
jgi:hypothetical protein